MPVVFIGHGSPENALDDNNFTKQWRSITGDIPKPQAILCVSAHWLVEGSALTAMDSPRTIHDFYGFAPELYQASYPAPGDTRLARQIASLLKSVKAGLDQEWGLDHGCWSVLKQMYPQADIPVLQLSLNYNLSPSQHYALGQELAALRQQGILILGSGNIVHNLMMLNWDGPPYPWAVDFEQAIREDLQSGNTGHLLDCHSYPGAALALPTDEHYLPLLYAYGAAGTSRVQFFNTEITAGSLAMTCALWT